MGFVRKTLKLTFDDPELEGFEVRARRLTVAQLLDIEEMRRVVGKTDDSPEVRDTLARVFLLLAGDPDAVPPKLGALISWNLEEPKDLDDPDGPTVPVPLSQEALANQDLALVMAITNALTDATTAVSGPLDRTSSDGVPSVELSMPMEPLSESPGS